MIFKDLVIGDKFMFLDRPYVLVKIKHGIGEIIKTEKGYPAVGKKAAVSSTCQIIKVDEEILI